MIFSVHVTTPSAPGWCGEALTLLLEDRYDPDPNFKVSTSHRERKIDEFIGEYIRWVSDGYHTPLSILLVKWDPEQTEVTSRVLAR